MTPESPRSAHVEVTCIFVPESGEPRLVYREPWNHGVPFDRTAYLWLTDRRADEPELHMLGKHLSRRGTVGATHRLQRHIDEARKCPDERDPHLIPLMTYWTVAYDETALMLCSKSRSNQSLGRVGLTIMGDAYLFMNIERRLGSKASHIIDADLIPNVISTALEAARAYAHGETYDP